MFGNSNCTTGVEKKVKINLIPKCEYYYYDERDKALYKKIWKERRDFSKLAHFCDFLSSLSEGERYEDEYRERFSNDTIKYLQSSADLDHLIELYPELDFEFLLSF